MNNDLPLEASPQGHPPREIAEKEITSIHTVRAYVRAIYPKLGVTRTEDASCSAETLGSLRWVHLDGNNHALRPIK